MYSVAMFNKGSFVFYYALFYFILQYHDVSGAMTDEEVKAEFTKVILQCAKDAALEMKDVLSLATLAVPTDPKVKCVLACAYRQKGSLDDKGMYDLEGSYKIIDIMYKGDDARIKKAKQFADHCAPEINDAKVSDGDKGCDRAALIFKCTVKNAAKYGFKI